MLSLQLHFDSMGHPIQQLAGTSVLESVSSVYVIINIHHHHHHHHQQAKRSSLVCLFVCILCWLHESLADAQRMQHEAYQCHHVPSQNGCSGHMDHTTCIRTTCLTPYASGYMHRSQASGYTHHATCIRSRVSYIKVLQALT